MRMIPSQPLDTHSRAELRVFDQLRSSFCDDNHLGWFALHSLNLPQHEYKRFGEIDFVVCGPEGLLVLEVKGGGVSCKEGVWETCNRYGQVERLRESPFKQAEGALHGLRKRLPDWPASGLVVGYGVIMPDVQNLPDSAEWDRATLCDAKEFRQFQRWLTRLISHWRDKDPRKPTAMQDQLREVQQFLRPDFEAVMPLHRSAHEAEERIARLTEDQLGFIDIVEANDRILCSGGAGTGKTMLALELAKRWSATGLRVVLACSSPWMKAYLARSASPGVVVSLVSSIRVAARRAGVEKFDALIVDEGQDLLNMEDLSVLDDALEGGLEQSRWCIFHDKNNQSGLCGVYTPDAYDYLKSFAPARIPLKTNCRNTQPILHHIQSSLKADLGTSGVGDGPAVREFAATKPEDATCILQDVLEKLLHDDGFELTEIVILSPKSMRQSCVASLPSKWARRIVELDEYSPRGTGSSTIGFAHIDSFKGLESPVVVLVDIETPRADAPDRAIHYVGMSRARVLLSMIYY